MICWALGERGQQEEPLVLAEASPPELRGARPWGSWGCCTGAFSADLAVGCAAEDASAAPACLPLSMACPCRPPALLSDTWSSLLLPCGSAAFPAAGHCLGCVFHSLLSHPLPTNPARSPHGHSGSTPPEHQQGTRKCFSQQMSYFCALMYPTGA